MGDGAKIPIDDLPGGTPMDTPREEIVRLIANYDRAANDGREWPDHRAHSRSVASGLRARLRRMDHG